LRAQLPFVQRTLPYPCVRVVFDALKSGVFGVPTGAFDYELKGAGKVCGLRFRAGAFRAFIKRPVHTITDQVLPISSIFPWVDAAAQRTVLEAVDDAAMVASASGLLCMNLPPPDPEVERIAAIFRTVESTLGLTQVEALAAG
jgi:hypothetical protein